MTAKMAVMSSPWQSDAWLSRDLLNHDELLSSNTVHDSTKRGWGGNVNLSVEGSECSDIDDILLDMEDLKGVDDDVFGLWGLDSGDGDIMQQTMMSILGETPVTENEHVVSIESQPGPSSPRPWWETTSASLDSVSSGLPSMTMDASDRSSSSLSESVIPSTPSSPAPTPCKRMSQHCRRNSRLNKKKPWKDLSITEKLQLAEELSNEISQQLGLREQLEVINIINPSASVRSADTHFVIELSWLTESKLQQVCDYLDKHQHKAKTCSAAKSSDHSNGTSSANHCIHGKVTKRQKRHSQRASLHKNPKEDRQVKREARSGLFKQEKVVALSNCVADDDEEEIDILT